MPSRIEIFERAAKKLRADFEELSNVPHAGEKGNQAERIVRQFLNGHLPRRFAATGGFILDQRDQVSKQTDVIVYDAFNCPVYRSDDEAAIIPNAHVAAVVEVKSKLTSERLLEAVENIAAAKRLVKPREPDDGPETNVTLTCLFAFESELTLPTIAKKYNDILAARGGVGDHIDLILVLDRGLINWATLLPRAPVWSKILLHGPGGIGSEGAHIGLASTELGYRSLDAFLRMFVAHLTRYRHVIFNPSFDWATLVPAVQSEIRYLFSFTSETDPEKRDEKLAAYRRDAIARMGAK